MNRLKETWHVGQSVWVQYRNAWHSATITGIGHKRIEVLIHLKNYDSYGVRLPEELCPRDSQLDGKDKPLPDFEEETNEE